MCVCEAGGYTSARKRWPVSPVTCRRVVFLVPPRGAGRPRVLESGAGGLSAEIVDGMLLMEMTEIGRDGRLRHQTGRRRQRQRRGQRGRGRRNQQRRLLRRRGRGGRLTAAGTGQTVIVAVVVVPTFELVALVANGELDARGVAGQRQDERERVVDGRHVLHRCGGRRARATTSAAAAATVQYRVVLLHVRAPRVLVRGPFVPRVPHEHLFVVRQVPHFDRAQHSPLRRLHNHVLQRHVAHVQPLPEVQVIGRRLREPHRPLGLLFRHLLLLLLLLL